MTQVKYRRPGGYRRPTSFDALYKRYDNGERYFEAACLAGQCSGGRELNNVNLAGADLRGASLKHTRFTNADLTDALLLEADLGKAQFSMCSLARADLRRANLYMLGVAYVCFLGARMNGALNSATIQWWSKSQAEGLIESPRAGASCFVSYPRAEPFAEQLSDALKIARVPNWFMPRSTWFSANIGENLRRAVGLCDVFALVLSKRAAGRRWVESEVASATSFARARGTPRMVILSTDNAPLPRDGVLAVLAGSPRIDCSGARAHAGIERFIALLKTSPPDREARGEHGTARESGR